MIDNIAELINGKASALVEELTLEYLKKRPEVVIDPEMKEKIMQRATSLLMFELSSLRIHDGEDTTDQFNAWYDAADTQHIKNQCYKYADELVEEKLSQDSPDMSILEKYLKKHDISLDD